jgi:choline dehydrogenase-like flavoprotein
MHSGIGPASELSKFNIPVVQDLPAVGQGLKDHFFAPLILMRNPETNDRNTFYGSESAMDDALTQWEEDGTGLWTRYGCQIGCGWFKSDRVTSLQEFKDLPASVQNFMNKETIPHYEIISGFPAHNMFPQLFQDYSYTCMVVFIMNEQSSGEVRLQSSNPEDPLLFDPKVLQHPFDQRAMVEIYKDLMEMTQHPSFAKDTVSTVLAPASESDEDILQFCKANVSSTWHMTGTVKMGKEGDINAAVDNRFRVFGIENLRVADMSVVPVLTNNHTQATAYLTGATCADVMIREYKLDQ